MYTLIVNPVAGHGRAMDRLPEITSQLTRLGADYTVVQTEKPGDATRIAQEAAQSGAEGVIALGGDGTLSEAAAGLAGGDVPLIIASCGTGNDFIKALGLPKDPIKALRAQFARPIRRFDICRANDRAFINVAGTGLDVDVLVHTEKYKSTRSGLSAYLRGVRDAIAGYAPKSARIRIDGGAYEQIRFSVLSIGNGRYIGGGIKAVPGAVLTDGKLDLVVVKPVKKWQIPPLFVLYMFGLHIAFGLAFKHELVESVELDCPGMTVQLDGELVRCDCASFAIQKASLPIRA